MRRQQELLADLRDTKCRLDAARNFFESVSDPDLVSAAVYQIDALQAQILLPAHPGKETQSRCTVPAAAGTRQAMNLPGGGRGAICE